MHMRSASPVLLAGSLFVLATAAFGTDLNLKRTDSNTFQADANIEALAGGDDDLRSPFSSNAALATISDSVSAMDGGETAGRNVAASILEASGAVQNDEVLLVNLAAGVEDVGDIDGGGYLPGFGPGCYVQAFGTCVFQPQVPMGSGITKGTLNAELDVIVTGSNANAVLNLICQVGSVVVESSPSFTGTTTISVDGVVQKFISTPLSINIIVTYTRIISASSGITFYCNTWSGSGLAPLPGQLQRTYTAQASATAVAWVEAIFPPSNPSLTAPSWACKNHPSNDPCDLEDPE